MKRKTKKDIRNEIMGLFFPNLKERINDTNASTEGKFYELFFRESSDALKETWVNSNCTDFSIYQDRELYMGELFICYGKVSSYAMRNSLSYIKENIPNYKDLKFFEDYPGIGLTTKDALAQGLNYTYFNNVEYQNQGIMTMCNYFGYDIPYNDIDRSGRYDGIFTFENVEHYSKPLDYIRGVDSMLNPGGYLFYSCGFSNMQPGHFYEYDFDGDIISSRRSNSKMKKFLVEELGYQVLDDKFWSGKPVIFRKPLL
jgi:hypothetical protein